MNKLIVTITFRRCKKWQKIVRIVDGIMVVTIVWGATHTMETLRNLNLSVVTATTPKVQTVVITVYGRRCKKWQKIVRIVDGIMVVTIVWVATHTMETLRKYKVFVVTATTQKEATPVTIVYGRNYGNL